MPALPQRTHLDFYGSSVVAVDDAANDASKVTVGVAVADEGSDQTVRNRLNFVGAGVALSDDAGGNRTTVTISGVSTDIYVNGVLVP